MAGLARATLMTVIAAAAILRVFEGPERPTYAQAAGGSMGLMAVVGKVVDKVNNYSTIIAPTGQAGAGVGAKSTLGHGAAPRAKQQIPEDRTRPSSCTAPPDGNQEKPKGSPRSKAVLTRRRLSQFGEISDCLSASLEMVKAGSAFIYTPKMVFFPLLKRAMQTACMLIFVRLHGFRLRMVPRSDTTVIWGTDVATLREDYVRDEVDHKPLGNPTLSDTCVATMEFIKVHTAAASGGTTDWYSLVNESGFRGNGSQLACAVNRSRELMTIAEGLHRIVGRHKY
ncbi:hypothetical protein C8R45DRAFT_933981 [Mycena sanguinolenta]|nr:hypothetical protein C8R45DRAFT_933981 [Mycena sanguinolenta]